MDRSEEAGLISKVRAEPHGPGLGCGRELWCHPGRALCVSSRPGEAGQEVLRPGRGSEGCTHRPRHPRLAGMAFLRPESQAARASPRRMRGRLAGCTFLQLSSRSADTAAFSHSHFSAVSVVEVRPGKTWSSSGLASLKGHVQAAAPQFVSALGRQSTFGTFWWCRQPRLQEAPGPHSHPPDCLPAGSGTFPFHQQHSMPHPHRRGHGLGAAGPAMGCRLIMAWDLWRHKAWNVVSTATESVGVQQCQIQGAGGNQEEGGKGAHPSPHPMGSTGA